jgi:hexosaminidase
MDKVTIALMLALLPQPSRVVRYDGAFPLTPETTIVVDQDSPDAANVGRMLAERINRSTGFAMTVTKSDVTGTIPNAILLTTKNAKAALGDEGYTLTASSDGVVIRASAGPGLFYGTQTLLQLLPPQVFSTKKVQEAVAWLVPAVKIEDQPRFGWRGLMLDVSRHFFNKEEVKNFIDLMAQHKMNTFHWHLADDPGWRVEIKRYPKLTEVGAWRKDILYGLNPKDGTEWGPDGRYGGFYTQDDIREIIAYAKDRYITIVPEIDMPGHSGSALAAYPEYTCTGKHDGPNEKMAVYCAGNDAGFEFIEGMLTELLELFPSKYIHIGGDEVDKANWKKCEKCQARMKQQGLKNENELQSYFIRRLEKFLNAHNRTLIGWDEILEGGLAPNATVMSWRGIDGGIAAAKAGHDVVMTPTSHCYFDYLQAKSGEPVGIGGFLPLNLVYSFEPIPAAITGDKAKHILGAGGNLWTEFVANYRHAQYMAYPRACAMAELTWSDPKQKNWADFRKRLDSQLLRLKAQGVNYRQPRPDDDAPAK